MTADSASTPLSLHCPACGTVVPMETLVGSAFACPACGEEIRVYRDHYGSTMLMTSPPRLLPGELDGGLPTEFMTGDVPDDLPSIGGCRLIRELGRGGMGVVYEAVQESLDRRVAVKVLARHLAQDPAFVKRFNREAKALAALSHPNIVSVLDKGQDNGLFYFIMEYVDGVSLRTLLSQKALGTDDALKYIPPICQALEYAHARGVVHRDIKPENILLDREGRVKIADFGLSRLVKSDVVQSRITGTNMVMGTVDYMAPEQRLASRDVDHRADLYSLGVVLYEMLTGELPLGHFLPPSERREGVNASLDPVILRALESEPVRRYQRASDIETAISCVQRGVPVPEPSPMPTYAQVFGMHPLDAMAAQRQQQLAAASAEIEVDDPEQLSAEDRDVTSLTTDTNPSDDKEDTSVPHHHHHNYQYQPPPPPPPPGYGYPPPPPGHHDPHAHHGHGHRHEASQEPEWVRSLQDNLNQAAAAVAHHARAAATGVREASERTDWKQVKADFKEAIDEAKRAVKQAVSKEKKRRKFGRKDGCVSVDCDEDDDDERGSGIHVQIGPRHHEDKGFRGPHLVLFIVLGLITNLEWLFIPLGVILYLKSYWKRTYNPDTKAGHEDGRQRIAQPAAAQGAQTASSVEPDKPKDRSRSPWRFSVILLGILIVMGGMAYGGITMMSVGMDNAAANLLFQLEPAAFAQSALIIGVVGLGVHIILALLGVWGMLTRNFIVGLLGIGLIALTTSAFMIHWQPEYQNYTAAVERWGQWEGKISSSDSATVKETLAAWAADPGTEEAFSGVPASAIVWRCRLWQADLAGEKNVWLDWTAFDREINAIGEMNERRWDELERRGEEIQLLSPVALPEGSRAGDPPPAPTETAPVAEQVPDAMTEPADAEAVASELEPTDGPAEPETPTVEPEPEEESAPAEAVPTES